MVKRLPQTEMLDLGQVFSDQRSYDVAPPEYRQAIEKYKRPHMF